MTPEKYLNSLGYSIDNSAEFITEHSWENIFELMHHYSEEIFKLKVLKLCYPYNRFFDYTELSTGKKSCFFGDIGYKFATGAGALDCLNNAFQKAISLKKNKRLRDLWEVEFDPR